jgi:hypothetical protein
MLMERLFQDIPGGIEAYTSNNASQGPSWKQPENYAFIFRERRKAAFDLEFDISSLKHFQHFDTRCEKRSYKLSAMITIASFFPFSDFTRGL